MQRLLVTRQSLDTQLLDRLRKEHADLQIVTLASDDWPAMAAQFEIESRPEQAYRFFLIDPLGNLMMAYAPDAPPKGVLKDLRKLLKVSQIG